MKPAILVFLMAFCAAMAAAQSSAEKQLFDLVNHEREQRGLGRLEWNGNLAAAALKHSKLLAEHQELSHQFDGEPALQERVGATGARFNAVAENVAEAPGVLVAHDGLMHSPGHRANILHADYNAIGIAIVQRGQQLFVTQDFAHALAFYTEKQFQAAMVAAVNQARRSLGMRALEVITDARLRRIACARDLNTDRIIQGLPGATRLFVFSRAEPGPLPDDLRRVVDDPQLERLNIGVCLETGGKTGFSKFWVVAAFYH
jgi:uncharacterized protein YkwD